MADPLIPEIKLEVNHERVKAKPRVLKVKWTVDESPAMVYRFVPSFWDKLLTFIARVTDTVVGPGTWAKVMQHTYWRWFPHSYEDELT